jgi:hypothetical protein
MINKIGLTCLMFLSVSGGPIGLETVFNYTDYYTAFKLMLWILITYMIPLAIMNYELIVKISIGRKKIGPIEWVSYVLGKDVGIINSTWDIIDTVIDNSIYPVIFADTVISMGANPDYRVLYGWGMILFVCMIIKCEFESIAAIIQTAIIILPFIIMWAMFEPSEMYMEPVENKTDDLIKAIIVIIWNISGYDMAAPYALKVNKPLESYKFAFFVNTILVFCMYIISFSIGISILHHNNEWSDGSWVTIANTIGGSWLGYIVGISILLSAAGTLTAELFSTIFLFKSLYAAGLGPKIFNNDKINLVINAVLLFASMFLNLNMLIQWSAILNSFTLLMECYVWYTINGLTWITTPCIFFICLNSLITMMSDDINCVLFTILCIGLSLIIWLTINTKKLSITN